MKLLILTFLFEPFWCNLHHISTSSSLLPLCFKLSNMATIKLTTDDFIDQIFDYRNEKEWKYKGSKPAIVDFYADWCGPCRMVAPALEELSEEYADQVNIYKVDTDKEMEISVVFGIQSIPSFLFIPMKGSPSMEPGALPKHAFKQIIEEHLLNPENANNTES